MRGGPRQFFVLVHGNCKVAVWLVDATSLLGAVRLRGKCRASHQHGFVQGPGGFMPAAGNTMSRLLGARLSWT